MILESGLHQRLFPKLDAEEQECVLEYGEQINASAGATLFAEGEPLEYMYMVVDGEVTVTRRAGGQEIRLAVHTGAGEFTGDLMLLTGGKSNATGRATKPSRLVRVDSKTLREVIGSCPTLATTFLRALSSRVQESNALVQQCEKLAALGRLSAGLAHELNNPAAAGRRSAHQLKSRLADLSRANLALAALHLEEKHLGCLAGLLKRISERPPGGPMLDSLALSEREEELMRWIEDHGATARSEDVSALAEAGMDLADLEIGHEKLGSKAFGVVLNWLACSVGTSSLTCDVERATDRIAEVVSAVKAYSYMDQGQQQEIDLHDGLDSTLTILSHKLKKGNVQVQRDYDRTIPRFFAHGGALNQVWTNLIDNALDAMKGEGTLTLKSFQDGDRAVVEVGDTGVGIPPEIRTRIFEPFFTTKAVGQGTGLGLDVVQRVAGQHGGEVRVSSKPGHTRFQVTLPMRATPQ
jgi:signal transduction histidine kinase